MSESSMTVTVDSRAAPVFAAAGAGVGLLTALLVGPVVSWLLARIDTAPGPLRLIDQLPLMWSVPLLILLGAAAGWAVFAVWNDEVGRVVVDPQQLRLESKKTSAVYSRAEIAEVFLDRDELVLVGDRAQELSRTPSDSSIATKLAGAFGAFNYPWAGTRDPREEAFADWVDRSASLDETVHALLRSRRRALADQRLGEAESAREQLAAHGVVVRDRGEKQQYRLVTS